MNIKITFLLISTIVTILNGCSSTGLKSYVALTTSEDPQIQNEAVVELMRIAREGSIIAQVKAEIHLRHLTRYQPVKQQVIGLRPLVWLSFVADDGYVRERSQSRISAILEGEYWDEQIRTESLESLSELILGQLGTPEELNERQYLMSAEKLEREGALKFILNEFPSINLATQEHAIFVFEKILSQEPLIELCPPEICEPEILINNASQEEYLAAKSKWQSKSEEIKFTLWQELQDSLDRNELNEAISQRIVDLNNLVASLPISSELKSRMTENPLSITRSQEES